MRSFLRPAAIALTLGLVDAPPAHACAPAPPPGEFVQIAEETALIVWNAETKQEHFIRRGAFRTGAKDFGFLVPTPSTPQLEGVPDAVISQFETMARPEIISGNHYSINPLPLIALPFFLFFSRAAATASAPEAVRVLDAKRIGGYDAVVLEADDSSALAKWLKDHGYDARPALKEWLQAYVDAHWKITAFKIAAGEPTVQTDAIRMTFTTDKPMYPYREPKDQRENLPPEAQFGSRMLRVFFLSNERVGATVGTGPFFGNATWSGPVKAPLKLPFSAPDKPWLTVFEDQSFPRPGTDELFFSRSTDQSELRPPPIRIGHDVDIPLPLDALALIAFIGWRIARRTKSSSSEQTTS